MGQQWRDIFDVAVGGFAADLDAVRKGPGFALGPAEHIFAIDLGHLD